MPDTRQGCLYRRFTACCAAMAPIPPDNIMTDQDLRAIARQLSTLLPAPAWSGQYRLPASSAPRFWRHWLLDNGSLTRRLVALKPGHFTVKLLREYRGHAHPAEYRQLRLTYQQPVWVREVALCIDHQCLVYGRTIIPLSTLRGKHRRLLSLGDRPLGQYLFQQPSMKRRSVTISRIHQPKLPVNWQRRSVFTLDSKPLLVTESFTEQLREYT